MTSDETARITLPGGWYLVCDAKRNWFLSAPNGVWVASFWDGPVAGYDDAHAFARAMGVEA